MMRRIALCFLAVLIATGAATPVLAQAAPPHAWLYGTWTGGIFPVPANVPPQACFGTPVVIFTRDLVMRGTLTEQLMAQREIETVRGTGTGVEFRFAAAPAGPALLGPPPRALTGFGCESADVLHVQRRGENEISFPGCAEFPNPLVRCQTR